MAFRRRTALLINFGLLLGSTLTRISRRLRMPWSASQIKGSRPNVERLHPALDRWMVEEGYGKVLSRGATDERTRELCIVALLGAANHERQLHSHLSGALNVGAAPDSVEEALEVGLARLSNAGDAGRLRALWQRVRSSRCSSISRASG